MIPGLQVLITRKFYDDVVQNFMEGPDGFRALLQPYRDAGLVKCTEDKVRWLKTGSLITLGHCSTDEAAQKAQGIPKNIWIVEEAPQLLERHIRFIRGWVTMSEPMKERIPKDFPVSLPCVIYTGNPIGASVAFFRKQFVMPAEMGTEFVAPEDEGGNTRVYIESRVEDNPHEDTDATRRRVRGMGDEGYSEALLEARWDASIGDYFKQWDDKLHTCEDFVPPHHWRPSTYLTFDWGSSDPFMAQWWAVSDGEEFEQRGRKFWFPRGAIILYREWYGCLKQDSGTGLHMPNKEIAEGIVERTYEETSGLVLTDSLPFQSKGTYKDGREYRIADEFEEAGVPLVRANTQRIYGWKQMRDRLIGITRDDGPNIPMLYVCRSCVYTREYIPALQRHPNPNKSEDAEEAGEATHACDCVRYACTAKPIVRDAPKPPQGFVKPKAPTVKDLAKAVIRKNKRRR